MESQNLSPALLGLAGLSVEYCRLLESSDETSPRDFISSVVKYLPRIYIMINDLASEYDEETGAISPAVDEDRYETVRSIVAVVLGQNDVYLDTPAEEMRYSDTPIGVSLSEQLADIFQNLADFAATVAEASEGIIPEIISDLKFRFKEYLSETLCSALRATNYLYQNHILEDGNE